LAVSGGCAAAFGPLTGAGAPQGLLVPLALLWGSAAVAVRNYGHTARQPQILRRESDARQTRIRPRD